MDRGEPEVLAHPANQARPGTVLGRVWADADVSGLVDHGDEALILVCHP